jgi:hypothetical protein
MRGVRSRPLPVSHGHFCPCVARLRRVSHSGAANALHPTATPVKSPSIAHSFQLSHCLPDISPPPMSHFPDTMSHTGNRERCAWCQAALLRILRAERPTALTLDDSCKSPQMRDFAAFLAKSLISRYRPREGCNRGRSPIPPQTNSGSRVCEKPANVGHPPKRADRPALSEVEGSVGATRRTSRAERLQVTFWGDSHHGRPCPNR